MMVSTPIIQAVVCTHLQLDRTFFEIASQSVQLSTVDGVYEQKDGIVEGEFTLFLCQFLNGTVDFHGLSIFFGRWPDLNPSACTLGTPPYIICVSPLFLPSLFCSFFFPIFNGTHTDTLKKEPKRKYTHKNIFIHIYIISQSITLVCPVANCLRKDSIILFLDPLYFLYVQLYKCSLHIYTYRGGHLCAAQSAFPSCPP